MVINFFTPGLFIALHVDKGEGLKYPTVPFQLGCNVSNTKKYNIKYL